MSGASEVIRIISEGTMEGRARGHTMEGNQTDEFIRSIVRLRAARLPLESRGREVGISMSASHAISNVDIRI